MDDPYFGAVLTILAFPVSLIGLGLLAALCRVAMWAAKAVAFALSKSSCAAARFAPSLLEECDE